jgi:glucoamylase
MDEWGTVSDTDATPTGLGIHFVDIPIDETQASPVRFTFFWPERGTWEGRDYQVDVLRP